MFEEEDWEDFDDEDDEDDQDDCIEFVNPICARKCVHIVEAI